MLEFYENLKTLVFFAVCLSLFFSLIEKTKVAVEKRFVNSKFLSPGYSHRRSTMLIERPDWKPNFLEIRFLLKQDSDFMSEKIALWKREDWKVPRGALKKAIQGGPEEVRVAIFSRSTFSPSRCDIDNYLDKILEGEALLKNKNWKISQFQIEKEIRNFEDIYKNRRLYIWKSLEWSPNTEQIDVGLMDPVEEIREIARIKGYHFLKEKHNFNKMKEITKFNSAL